VNLGVEPGFLKRLPDEEDIGLVVLGDQYLAGPAALALTRGA